MTHRCVQCHRVYAQGFSKCLDDGAPVLPDVKQGDALVGTVLDNRFRIDAMLGQGGMGTVYRGTQKSIGRTFAIKTLRAELTQSEDAVRRFYREARLVSQLNHPNIVTVFDFGATADGLLYLVMEFVAGPTLYRALRRGRMALPRVVHIVGQVCDALSEAHTIGIIHRDLKPENIVLTENAAQRDIVKVLDFGVATVVRDGGPSGTRITRLGAAVGTPRYMSPEQVNGVAALTPASDLYALTLILLEMFSGRQAFADSNAAQVLVSQVSAPPPTLGELAPDLAWPEQMDAFVARGLAKTESHRAQDAQTYKRMLQAAASGQPFEPAVAASFDRPLAMAAADDAGRVGTGNTDLISAATQDHTGGHSSEMATEIRRQPPRWVAPLSNLTAAADLGSQAQTARALPDVAAEVRPDASELPAAYTEMYSVSSPEPHAASPAAVQASASPDHPPDGPTPQTNAVAPIAQPQPAMTGTASDGTTAAVPARVATAPPRDTATAHSPDPAQPSSRRTAGIVLIGLLAIAAGVAWQVAHVRQQPVARASAAPTVPVQPPLGLPATERPDTNATAVSGATASPTSGGGLPQAATPAAAAPPTKPDATVRKKARVNRFGLE